jgi:hypothetical protein
MAHFAQIDTNNVVLQVITVSNNELIDLDGKESEAKGIAFCQSLFGPDTRWVQTSYNANFRKNYAAIGGTYSSEYDAFVPPKPPYPASLVINPNTCLWEVKDEATNLPILFSNLSYAVKKSLTEEELP